MASDLPETLHISKTIPTRVGRAAMGGHNYVGEDGRWFVRLSLGDSAGERHFDLYQADTFEFAGATWEVTKVYEPSTSTRGSVATFTRVS